MINQTIVPLGGAYVERVSNPPDVHNLQTSRSVGGGVSNGCESNERNVFFGKQQLSNRSTIGIGSLFTNVYSNIFIRPIFCYCQIRTGQIRNCCQWSNRGVQFRRLRRPRHNSISNVLGRKYITVQHWSRILCNGLFYCVRLNLESGVVA